MVSKSAKGKGALASQEKRGAVRGGSDLYVSIQEALSMFRNNTKWVRQQATLQRCTKLTMMGEHRALCKVIGSTKKKIFVCAYRSKICILIRLVRRDCYLVH